MDLCTYFSFLLECPRFSPWQNPYILQNSVYMSAPLRSLPWMSPSWHSQSIFCNFSYHFVSTSILARFLLHFIYVSTSVLHQILSFLRDEPVSHFIFILCLPSTESVSNSKQPINLVELMKWNKINKNPWNCQPCGFRKGSVSFAWHFVMNFGWVNEVRWKRSALYHFLPW